MQCGHSVLDFCDAECDRRVVMDLDLDFFDLLFDLAAIQKSHILQPDRFCFAIRTTTLVTATMQHML